MITIDLKAGTVNADGRQGTVIISLDGGNATGGGGGISQEEADARYVNTGGDTMTGALILQANPTSPLGAATKAYVDASPGTGISQADGDARYVNTTGDTMAGALTLAANPSAAMHAATKAYVDSNPGTGITQADADTRYINTAGDTMTGALVLNGPPAAPLQAATKAYVDAADALALTQAAADTRYINTAGDTMTGSLTLAADPTAPMQAVTKQYADNLAGSGMTQAAADVRYINTAGDTMTGPLILPGEPGGALHATTKAYVDARPSGQVYYQPDGIAPSGVMGDMWLVPEADPQPLTFGAAVNAISGLVAYYPLNSYYALTDVKGGRNATNAGGVTFATDGAHFTGVSNSYLSIADNAVFSAVTTGSLTIVSSMTVGNWAEAGRGSPDGFVHWLGKGEGSQHEWTFRHYFSPDMSGEDPPRPKRVSFYHFNPGGGLGAGSFFQDDVAAGVEMLVAGAVTGTTANGGYTRIWRDAIERDTDLLSGYSITPVDGTAPVRMGTRDMVSGFFVGTLRRVAVYNKVLSSAELLTLKAAALRPEGYWNAGAPATATFFTTVKDTFDTAFNAIWTNNNLAAVVSGEARITTQTSAGSRLATGYVATLRGSSCQFKMLPPVDPSGGTASTTYVRARINASAQPNEMLDIIIRPLENTISFRNLDSTLTDTTPGVGSALMTYVPAEMVYVRFRESGGFVSWETSADGVKWKTRRQDPTPAWMTAAPDQRLYIETQKPGGGAATYAVVDNVNQGPETITATGVPLRVHDGTAWRDVT